MNEFPPSPLQINGKGNPTPRFGVALGGGGVRGFAHIGVLKVLEGNGFKPDCLAGASMGGLIAALYAAGWSPSQLEAEVERITQPREFFRLLDLDPHRRGLLEGHRVRLYLENLIGKDRTFESLDTCLGLVTVDLLSGKEIVLSQGPLVDAVMATVAVPALLPPVPYGTTLLADGGLLNDLPVDVVQAMGARVTLAVDVSPELPGNQSSGVGIDNSWPSYLPSFVRDFYLAELIMITTITNYRLKEASPNLILRPNIPPAVSIFWGLSHFGDAIKAGEQAASDSVGKIRKEIEAII